MSDDLDYSQLDPNIRQVVRFLRSRGFETTDSGDGRWKWRCAGCGALPGEFHGCTAECGRLAGKLCRREQKGLGVALAIPHVFCHVEHTDQLVTEARRMMHALAEVGVKFEVSEQSAIAIQMGLEPPDAVVLIEATYSPIDGGASIMLTGLNDDGFMAARP